MISDRNEIFTFDEERGTNSVINAHFIILIARFKLEPCADFIEKQLLRLLDKNKVISCFASLKIRRKDFCISDFCDNFYLKNLT